VRVIPNALPSLAPRTLALSSARRVVLVVYNAERGTIDWRHFRSTIKLYGVSRRILQGAGTGTGDGIGAVLDLGNERDVADYVLRAHGDDGRVGGAVCRGGGG